MQILSAQQIRDWDAFTLERQNVNSIDLMERAVTTCFEWLGQNGYANRPFVIYCGKGNNGGDGLALARMLSASSAKVIVYILEFGHKGTEDFQKNLIRLHNTGVELFFIQSEDHLHAVPKDTIVIDALFGSGLNRPPEGVSGRLIEHINTSGNEVISIDMPSGMFADKSSQGGPVIKAAHTLSFQCYKLAFLVAENEAHFGEVHLLDIGLEPAYLETIQADLELIEHKDIKAIYRPRRSFAHKGSYGHALLLAGSYGKMGACVLAAKACLRTGAGLLSCVIPSCGYTVMQTSVPEAMVITDTAERYISTFDVDLSRYQALGIGPGLGTEKETKKILDQVLTGFDKPVVLDADGLNMLSTVENGLALLRPFSVLTPHPKEFERLFGDSASDFDRIALARQKAKEWQVIIVLKGHHSFVAMPGGKGYFNSTGNAGMATGGSGDVLTGVLTSLLAQGYPPEQAAVIGVYLHGLAGDLAAEFLGEEALIASDIVECLGEAFLEIATPPNFKTAR